MQNIKICDVSLSEISNSSLSLSFKEKLEVAKKLDELGVDVIELGAISNLKSDEVLVKTLSTCITKTTLGVVCENNESSIEKTFSLIANAKKKKLIIKIPVSPVNMEYTFSAKPPVVLNLIKTLTEKAVSFTDTEVCFEDATRAENEFLYNAISTAICAGAKSICISDKAGLLDVNEFKSFIENIKSNVQDINKVELFIEVSNAFNMATSSMLETFSCGVNGVNLSALNIGNLADFDGFFRTIEYIGAKKGYSSKLNKTCITRILNQICAISQSKPSCVNVKENSSDVSYLEKNYTYSELNKLLKKMGYDLSNEDTKKVLEEIVRIGEKKDLTTKDLDSIVAVTALQVPSTYKLVNYAVHCSNVISSTANITLEIDNKQITGVAIGNGSIDSAFLAIENAVGRHFDLDEFVVNSVTEGKEAMGETVIKLISNGKLYSGMGVSTDIVGASIRAYINAVNKIVYEEQE